MLLASGPLMRAVQQIGSPLILTVPSNTKTVEYNVGVSNVADNLLDSSVIVDKAGDLQCDGCGDCTSCLSGPMCLSALLHQPAAQELCFLPQLRGRPARLRRRWLPAPLRREELPQVG